MVIEPKHDLCSHEAQAFRRAFTLVELLVVIVIIAMLVALLLPAVQAARGAARKTQCTNNIRQLALAFQNYHDTKGYFPESQVGSGEPDGHGGCRGGMYSWHARVLPYIEETALHDSIDFNTNMADSCTAGKDGTISQLHPNANAAAAEVAVFLCPSDGVTGTNPSSWERPILRRTTTLRTRAGQQRQQESAEAMNLQ